MSKFLKTIELYTSIRQVQFIVFAIFTRKVLTSAYYTISLLLVNNLHEKCITEKEDG